MSRCLPPRSTTGWERREKKATLSGAYATWVKKSFSGYLVIDEVHDGPHTLFYAVDPVARKRVSFKHTEQGATEQTAREFLIQLQTYPLVVQGVTTDGSSIYPGPLAEIFPGAVHQVCEFHILKELNLLVLRVVASVRRRLRETLPKPPRGRRKVLSGEQNKLQQTYQRQRQKLRDLWEYRTLFVKKQLTDEERLTLQRITRGLAELRAVRKLVDLIYQLFDRRCTTAMALRRLQALRRHRLFVRFPALQPLQRKLLSPNLEKALQFLDDELLESTSNAAERANRRHRKMQKTVYRFRCSRMIVARITIDMLLEFQRRTRGPPSAASSSQNGYRRAVA